jgi:hypothetical protein
MGSKLANRVGGVFHPPLQPFRVGELRPGRQHSVMIQFSVFTYLLVVGYTAREQRSTDDDHGPMSRLFRHLRDLRRVVKNA